MIIYFLILQSPAPVSWQFARFLLVMETLVMSCIEYCLNFPCLRFPSRFPMVRRPVWRSPPSGMGVDGREVVCWLISGVRDLCNECSLSCATVWMVAPLIQAALLTHCDMWMFVFNGSVCCLPPRYLWGVGKCFFFKYCIAMSKPIHGRGHLPKRMYLPGGPLGPLKADGWNAFFPFL